MPVEAQKCASRAGSARRSACSTRLLPVPAGPEKKTPARGRELTFLQQLLNAQPGTGSRNMDDRNPGGGEGARHRCCTVRPSRLDLDKNKR